MKEQLPLVNLTDPWCHSPGFQFFVPPNFVLRSNDNTWQNEEATTIWECKAFCDVLFQTIPPKKPDTNTFAMSNWTLFWGKAKWFLRYVWIVVALVSSRAAGLISELGCKRFISIRRDIFSALWIQPKVILFLFICKEWEIYTLALLECKCSCGFLPLPSNMEESMQMETFVYKRSIQEWTQLSHWYIGKHKSDPWIQKSEESSQGIYICQVMLIGLQQVILPLWNFPSALLKLGFYPSRETLFYVYMAFQSPDFI